MKWIYSDGGRSNYFKGSANDCVCRSIAIANNMDYKDVYDLINSYIDKEPLDEKYINNARDGISKELSRKILEDLGWIYTPTMKFGSGCTIHLKKEELPKGRLIVQVSKHLTTVIDGVIYDCFDPSRQGTRCVYGFWTKKQEI